VHPDLNEPAVGRIAIQNVRHIRELAAMKQPTEVRRVVMNVFRNVTRIGVRNVLQSVTWNAANVQSAPSEVPTGAVKSEPNDQNLVQTVRRAFAKSALCRRDQMLKNTMTRTVWKISTRKTPAKNTETSRVGLIRCRRSSKATWRTINGTTIGADHRAADLVHVDKRLTQLFGGWVARP